MGILKGPRSSLLCPLAQKWCGRSPIDEAALFRVSCFWRATRFTLGSPLGTHQCRYGRDRTLLAPERVSSSLRSRCFSPARRYHAVFNIPSHQSNTGCTVYFCDPSHFVRDIMVYMSRCGLWSRNLIDIIGCVFKDMHRVSQHLHCSTREQRLTLVSALWLISLTSAMRFRGGQQLCRIILIKGFDCPFPLTCCASLAVDNHRKHPLSFHLVMWTHQLK